MLICVAFDDFSYFSLFILSIIFDAFHADYWWWADYFDDVLSYDASPIAISFQRFITK